MVTIINGEIVQDNDPRAQAYKQRNRRPESLTEQGVQGGPNSFSTRQRPNGPSVLGQGSMLDQLNNKLLDAGFPRWNLGQNVVQPIVSVILLLALLLFGLKGLLIVGFIWFMLRHSAGQQ
ncbi:protein FAM241B-like [Actinia tenebrosa]|uniref:Protein FAM241B-like n=1 Tax=Actinia tenebrosa TaxID=6105 RepID=A0A6P8HKV2_ACTTE|nr:protein FAM241B-like [Actinia tenebrosa]